MVCFRWVAALSMVLSIMGWGGAAAAIAADELDNVPRMSATELNAMLGNPNLLIIDVRTGRTWDEAPLKIKGAERRDPMTDDWMEQLPRDKTIVLYCT